MLVTIDEPTCFDAATVGAKASGLARARAAGLPVPDTVVVPCAVSRSAIAAGQALAVTRGVHAGRLEVMDAPDPLPVDALPALHALGGSLAVRSSAPTEDDPLLAGAFGSLVGVSPAEVPVAVRSVWASAIRDSAGSAPSIGVVIQPALEPTYAGSAELLADGDVEVVWTDGPAAPLMDGWEPGRRVRVRTTDTSPSDVDGEEGAVVVAVAALTRSVGARLGDEFVEWAWSHGSLWLVQCGPRPSEAASSWSELREPEDASPPASDGRVLRGVLRAAEAPGPCGERWLLPWHVASTAPLPEAGGSHGDVDVPTLWARLRELSDELTRRVWQVPRGSEGVVAATVASALRRGDWPEHVLSSPTPPDERKVRELVGVAASLRRALAVEGRGLTPAELWCRAVDGSAPAGARSRENAARSWEPQLFETVRSVGVTWRGGGVAPGQGCGPAVWAHDAALTEGRDLPPRAVLVADHPLPRFSPLLMNASALVTHGGSAAAHLVSVARSLDVPVVTGCDVRAFVRPDAGQLLAVDGDLGVVHVLDPAEAAS